MSFGGFNFSGRIGQMREQMRNQAAPADAPAPPVEAAPAAPSMMGAAQAVARNQATAVRQNTDSANPSGFIEQAQRQASTMRSNRVAPPGHDCN